MAYNSSGVYSRVHDFTDDRDNGIKIQASRMDAEMDGLATGLTTALTKNGSSTTTAIVPFAVGLSIIDNQSAIFGTNSDYTLQYDEATRDSLFLTSNIEGAAFKLTLAADQGDDASDEWQIGINTSGVLSIGNDINSAQTYVSQITLTPHATVASSTTAVLGNLTVGGSLTLDTVTNSGTNITLDSSGDIILDADGANVTIKDGGTSILDIANNSTDVELTVSTADKNFKIKGTDGASAITALDIDMALAGKAIFSGDVVVTGDLTISGDDITMGTNTAGHILVADGTNFNPVAVTDLSAISTVASGDTLLAVDASGGGLKKIARSVLVAGLATSSAISNISEDDTPQLGGNLDLNGSDIVTTSNATLDLAPNGTGTVVVRGNTNSGAIVFNCESNTHGQKVFGQPHSASVTNTLMLPAGANSTLVSLVSSDTLTNKTLTAPILTGTAVMADLDISGDVDVDGTLEADAITLNGTAITATATLATGIANTNVPKFTSGVADNDFLRVNGTLIEGRSASELASDIGAATEATAVALALALG